MLLAQDSEQARTAPGCRDNTIKHSPKLAILKCTQNEAAAAVSQIKQFSVTSEIQSAVSPTRFPCVQNRR